MWTHFFNVSGKVEPPSSSCLYRSNLKKLEEIETSLMTDPVWPHLDSPGLCSESRTSGKLIQTRLCVLMNVPSDQLLQPGVSRGSSLHLHRHRRPLVVLLQHLLLLQPVPDQVPAAVLLRGPSADQRWGWSGEPVCSARQHPAVDSRTSVWWGTRGNWGTNWCKSQENQEKISEHFKCCGF